MLLQIDDIIRSHVVQFMESAGKNMAAQKYEHVDKASLSLDGVDMIDKKLKELSDLMVRLGKLVQKDAKILDTINKDFKKLDQSASKT